MKLSRWHTLLSDCEELYFRELYDAGEAKFRLEASPGGVYEVRLGGFCGPYIVVDEEYLTKYWALCRTGIGWTFVVDDSDLVKCYPGVADSRVLTHYVVSTMDSCLEVLAEREPEIYEIALG